jgi:alpha-methylacyl-CoA racemase
LRQQAPYPRFVGEPAVTPRPAPELGADTAEVLADVGVDADAFARLREQGVV